MSPIDVILWALAVLVALVVLAVVTLALWLACELLADVVKSVRAKRAAEADS